MRLLALRPIGRLIEAFRRNRDGVAAIEFAFIAPVMILIFLATFEIGRAYSIYRRVANTTDTIGDLVARELSVSDANVNGILALVPAAMEPHPTDPNLQIQIIPLYATGANRSQISVYARPPARGTASHSCGSYQVTDQEKQLLQSINAGFIMVKATYNYRPMFLSGFSVPWEYEQMFAPRRTACVVFDSFCGARPAICSAA
jgi:Flp pilus assembly pilin Flp